MNLTYTFSKGGIDHASEVIGEHLLHTTLLLCLAFELVEVLRCEITNRVRRLEVQWQHAFGREDVEQHVHDAPER